MSRKSNLITTLADLHAKFDGLTELLEDRNLILKMLMRKEMREDFLLKERLQSLDEVGGYDVKSMNRNEDQSTVNEMMHPMHIRQPGDIQE